MNYFLRYQRLILICILIIAAVLRFGLLWRGDPINDEVLMAFRAIGLVDFDEAEVQTTPMEWFDSGARVAPNIPDTYRIGTGIPWWVRISWHDQPPLVFLTQNFFMRVFGEHPWAFRFPSALLGIASVYLVYLIGRKIFARESNSQVGVGLPGEFAGLFSALFYAITLNAVYISRTGMQEPYVIFFILWTIYALLRAREQKSFYILAGIALGLGILSKYTAFFLGVPLTITWILWHDRAAFVSKYFWIGVAFVLLFISPIIVYNIGLYRAVEHFDFQFSYIFRQTHPVWQVEPGKDIGTITNRLHNFIPRLIATNSWVFLGLFVASIIGFLWRLLKSFRATLQQYAFLLLWFGATLLLLLAIGPAYRFLTMLTPLMALSAGYFLSFFLQSRHSSSSRELLRQLFFTAIIVFEIFYSWNNQIAYYPKGPEPWLASKVRYENYNWGYNELDAYFENEFSGRIPALTFDLRYVFLEKFRQAAIDDGLRKGYAPFPALVITYGNFDKAGKLWALDRLHIYHAWPVISLSDYYDYLKTNGADFYTRSGFKNFYFVIPINTVSAPEFSQLITGIVPIEIKNPRGDTAFLTYKK